MDFIPANESRFIIRFFDIYTRFLLRRRFKHCWIKQEYKPKSSSRTVYYLNHNSWWDGLIPLYLNRTRFHQQARALMEDKQMQSYPFFSRIGAFSINLDDSRSTLRSLRYAVESLQREHSCLFMYPEGKLQPVSEKKPDFKGGLGWLYDNTEDVDFVPIALYMHSFRDSKPELYISIGKKSEFDNYVSRNQLTYLLETEIQTLLKSTREVAGFTDEDFEQVF